MNSLLTGPPEVKKRPITDSLQVGHEPPGCVRGPGYKLLDLLKGKPEFFQRFHPNYLGSDYRKAEVYAV